MRPEDQLDLFSTPSGAARTIAPDYQPSSTVTAAEMGRAGMIRGMEQAREHAEREEPGWHERAYAHLLEVARTSATFIAPDVRRSFRGPAAPTAFAWGSVVARAKRDGRIVKAGTTTYGDETMHTQNVTVWRTA